MISPWISPLHRATMPQDSEMFYRDLQILAHAYIRDREGMQHNAANPLLGPRDAHRHNEHPLALQSRIFEHLSDIDTQRVGGSHLSEVFLGELPSILQPAID